MHFISATLMNIGTVCVLSCTSMQALSETASPSDFSTQYKTYSAALEKQTNPILLAEQAAILASLSADEFGATHDNTINLTISAANHYRNASEAKLAASYYDKALSLFEDGDKTASVDYLLLLVEILEAKQIIAYKDKKKVTIRLRKSLENYFKTTDPKETILTTLRVYEIIIYNGQTSGRGRPLRKLGDDIIKAAEQHLAKEHLSLIKAQFAHAKLLLAIKAKEDAIVFFSKIIDTTESAVSFTHPFALGAHAQLVGIYESKNDSETATQHCLAIGRMKPWKDDIEPRPLYRVNPDYPINYAREGKQGSAIFQFDISPFGFVENAQLISVEGGRRFGDNGMSAIEKWRYAPKFEDGKAVVAKGLTVRLDFTMSGKGQDLKNI